MRYHRFAYSTPLRSGEEPNISKIRDGAAFSELTEPLANLGYEYGHLIFNPPYSHRKSSEKNGETFHFIKPEDLIVLTTRPPLDDLRHGDKRLVQRSGTHLEEQIFAECRKFLAVCARTHVRLTSVVGAGFEKADMVFHSYRSARLKSFKRLDEFRPIMVPPESNVAIGFLLWSKSIPEYGCGLVAAFGMGGRETLIWNHIVRTRYPERMHQTDFLVVEMDLAGIPPCPMTLEFVDRIEVKVLLKHPME